MKKRKSNVKNPVSNFMAFGVIFVIFGFVKRMIKKYHTRQEFFF